MKNPTTPDINRIIRTATILAVSSQAQFSEAPGRGTTRAFYGRWVGRPLSVKALIVESPAVPRPHHITTQWCSNIGNG